MLENICVNYKLYEMHLLRITLAQEMSDFGILFGFCSHKLYLQHGGML